MANHTITVCRGCGAEDDSDADAPLCRLCEAEQEAGPIGNPVCTAAKRSTFDWMTRDQLLVSAIQLVADCERLRRELDAATGLIR